LDPYPYEILEEARNIQYFYENIFRVYIDCEQEMKTKQDIHTRSILLSYLHNSGPIVKRHETVTKESITKVLFDVTRLCCIRDITYQLLHSVLHYYPLIHARKRLSIMDIVRTKKKYTHGFWGGTLNVKKKSISTNE
jgi:hypothetical protein